VNTNTSIHARQNTEISRNVPSSVAPGGSIELSDPDRPGTRVILFPPLSQFDEPDTTDREAASVFWQYLANVAADMATYTA
jgi:hypothetical protein